jgi:2,4-dichlorophenol 6-monooxygenase
MLRPHHGSKWPLRSCVNLPFLRVVATGAPDAQDLYCAWQRLREIDEAGALLIRPDGHVAWRAKSGADEHEAQNQLRQALEAILAKPLSDIQPVAPSANFTTAKHSAPELFA